MTVFLFALRHSAKTFVRKTVSKQYINMWGWADEKFYSFFWQTFSELQS